MVLIGGSLSMKMPTIEQQKHPREVAEIYRVWERWVKQASRLPPGLIGGRLGFWR